jgi:23S rRNA (cytidine2498-2'-O)-methyltransferase
MTQRIYIYACEPSWEAPLVEELGRVFPQSHHRPADAGWVASEMATDEPAAAPSVVLASQCLPEAIAVDAGSISAWVQSAGRHVIERLKDDAGPWRLHVFGVYRPGGPVGRRRCDLIAEGIVELLRKKQRRLLRTLRPAAEPWTDGETLVQIGLVTAARGFLSVCGPQLRHVLRRCVSPFPGGVVEVPPDRGAPSRALAKLLEVELRMGQPIAAGETCVDLGSSPGSWAYLALARGARVTAVDRSPLRDDLMKHPNLTFIRGDAFAYRPPAAADWLLCDVIAFPARILELLRTWLAGRWCRRFCVTIKFRGTADYAQLEPIKAWLASSGAEFTLRRLTHNKNEVTAYGALS